MRQTYSKRGQAVTDPVDYEFVSRFVLTTEKGSSTRNSAVDLWVNDRGYVYQMSDSGELPRNPMGRLLGVMYHASWIEIMESLGMPMNRTTFPRDVYTKHFQKDVRQDWIRGRTADKPEYADRLVLIPPIDPGQRSTVNMEYLVAEMYEFDRE